MRITSKLHRTLLIVPVFLLMSCESMKNEVKPETCFGPAIKIFDNTNIKAVQNGGTSPTFNVPPDKNKAYCLTAIQTYHWNGGQGQAPGTVGIEVGAGNQKNWQATASAGQGGAPNVNWKVDVNELILLRNTAGPYKVLDSNPATWSQNNDTQGKGFAIVWVQEYAEP